MRRCRTVRPRSRPGTRPAPPRRLVRSLPWAPLPRASLSVGACARPCIAAAAKRKAGVRGAPVRPAGSGRCAAAARRRWPGGAAGQCPHTRLLRSRGASARSTMVQYDTPSQQPHCPGGPDRVTKRWQQGSRTAWLLLCGPSSPPRHASPAALRQYTGRDGRARGAAPAASAAPGAGRACRVAARQQAQRELGLHRAHVAQAAAAHARHGLVGGVLRRHQRRLREDLLALLIVLRPWRGRARRAAAKRSPGGRGAGLGRARVANSPLPLPPPASARTSSAQPPRSSSCAAGGCARQRAEACRLRECGAGGAPAQSRLPGAREPAAPAALQPVRPARGTFA